MKWWPITSEKACTLRASTSSWSRQIAQQQAHVVHAPVVDAQEALRDRLVTPGPVADGQVDRQ
jgi:hypothetical protein